MPVLVEHIQSSCISDRIQLWDVPVETLLLRASCYVFVEKIWYGSPQQILCYWGYNVNRSEVWSSHSIFLSRLPWHVFDWNEDQLYLRYNTRFPLNWLTGGRWLQHDVWLMTSNHNQGGVHSGHYNLPLLIVIASIICFWLTCLCWPKAQFLQKCAQLWNYLKKNYTLFSFDWHIWCALLCLLCNWIAQNTFLLEMHKVCFIPDSTHRIILTINMIELVV